MEKFFWYQFLNITVKEHKMKRDQLSSSAILNITPVPIKLMEKEYYTNWLPIEEINAETDHIVSSRFRSKFKKCIKANAFKSSANPLIRSHSESSSPRFKMHQFKREENQIKSIKRDNEPLAQKSPQINKINSMKNSKKSLKTKITQSRHLEENDENQVNFPHKNKKKNTKGKELNRKRQKTHKNDGKKSMKSVKKVSKVEEDNILKSKRSLIIFDYYGIASTSGSDSPESDNFFKKD